MSTLYTRKGDQGYTGVLGEGRLPKFDHRIEAIGQVDEATAALGLARSMVQLESSRQIILKLQRFLYRLMAEVAATADNAERFRAVTPEDVTWLEAETEILTNQVNLPKEFIVPGDTQAGAALDLARTVIRRAERHATELVHSGEVPNEEVIKFLNRLSSFIFVLELHENQAAGKEKPTLAKDL